YTTLFRSPGPVVQPGVDDAAVVTALVGRDASLRLEHDQRSDSTSDERTGGRQPDEPASNDGNVVLPLHARPPFLDLGMTRSALPPPGSRSRVCGPARRFRCNRGARRRGGSAALAGRARTPAHAAHRRPRLGAAPAGPPAPRHGVTDITRSGCDLRASPGCARGICCFRATGGTGTALPQLHGTGAGRAAPPGRDWFSTAT